jgi:DNA-binding CsgD family transcriptional regulator/tetratricopeptide (TPR) repeat protein
LPRILREALLQRVARLGPGSQAVLRVAAAAGRDVSYGLLAAVATLSAQALHDSLRAAVDAHVLVPDHEAGTYRFRHALLAEAVYSTLLPGEREELHALLATALSQQPDLGTTRVVAGELAQHWAAAGRRVEALSASLRAARDAEAVSGRAEALRHLERALALWPYVSDAADLAGTQRRTLLAEAAELAHLTGAGPRAAELVREAIGLCDDAAEPVRVASLYERLGTYLLPTGQREDGLAAFRRAVAFVPAEPASAERVRVLAALGNALLLSARYDESRSVCEQAIAVAAVIGDRMYVRRAVHVLGSDLCVLGRSDEGLALLFDACARATEADSPPDLTRPYVMLSDSLIRVGRRAEAVRIAEQGLTIARGLGIERGVGTVLANNLAEALLDLGDWERAEAVLAAALRSGGAFWSHGPHVLRAQLAIARGEFDTARHHLAAGAHAAHEPPSAPSYALLLAELALWEGNADVAANAVNNALRAGETVEAVARVRLCASGLRAEANRMRLALARRDADTVDQARQRARVLLQDARRSARQAAGAPDAVGWQAVAEAEYGNVAGRPEPRRWETAATAWEQRDRPYPAAYCRWQHAVALLTTASTGPEATSSARSAHRVATRLRAWPLQREVELLAQRARLDLVGRQRVEQPNGMKALGVTAREVEVLHLLGRGYTNRQIADELTISIKTASVHVSHILRKLGVSRRLQAAAVAHQLMPPAEQRHTPGHRQT